MRYITILLTLALMLLSSCMHEPIHQGNRLDEKKVFQVKEGDTKFHVEQILGTPMLHSTLYSNRATYYEEYEDGVANYSIALVELEDGTIAEVLPKNIKFINE